MHSLISARSLRPARGVMSARRCVFAIAGLGITLGLAACQSSGVQSRSDLVFLQQGGNSNLRVVPLTGPGAPQGVANGRGGVVIGSATGFASTTGQAQDAVLQPLLETPRTIDVSRTFDVNRSVDVSRTVDSGRSIDSGRSFDVSRSVSVDRSVTVGRDFSTGGTAVDAAGRTFDSRGRVVSSGVGGVVVPQRGVDTGRTGDGSNSLVISRVIPPNETTARRVAVLLPPDPSARFVPLFGRDIPADLRTSGAARFRPPISPRVSASLSPAEMHDGVPPLTEAAVGELRLQGLRPIDFDPAFRAEVDALTAPLGIAEDWRSSATGNSGSIVPLREGIDRTTGLPCREFSAVVRIRGASFTGKAIACEVGAGAWMPVVSQQDSLR